MKISTHTVRADFNDINTVIHYARASHFLGLWKSEALMIERFFPKKQARLLEAGCGAGRVTIGLWELGYQNLTAFDFAEELLDQARNLAVQRDAAGIRYFHADATRLVDHTAPLMAEKKAHSPHHKTESAASGPVFYKDPTMSAEEVEGGFDGALFMFNGLMQIPGREHRRKALRGIAGLCAEGAPFLFTTHDRNVSRTEQALWRLEAVRWERGEQNPRLVDFGDRYFEDETGRTFMHLPDREEILEDLASTGWTHQFDDLRRHLCRETKAVRDFSDECRFWCATRAGKS